MKLIKKKEAHPNVNDVEIKEPNFLSWVFTPVKRYQSLHVNAPPCILFFYLFIS